MLKRHCVLICLERCTLYAIRVWPGSLHCCKLFVSLSLQELQLHKPWVPLRLRQLCWQQAQIAVRSALLFKNVQKKNICISSAFHNGTINKYNLMHWSGTNMFSKPGQLFTALILLIISFTFIPHMKKNKPKKQWPLLLSNYTIEIVWYELILKLI